MERQGNRPENKVVLYNYLSQKLASEGITHKEIKSIEHLPMGHHTVGGFIEANLTVGNFVRRGERIVNASRKLTLKLTKDEEAMLEARSEEAGQSAHEFASKIILEALSL